MAEIPKRRVASGICPAPHRTSHIEQLSDGLYHSQCGGFAKRQSDLYHGPDQLYPSHSHLFDDKRSPLFDKGPCLFFRASAKADSVISNPLHLAVALHCDPASMQAVTIVTEGAGILAKRIKHIALQHDIPRVEDKPLAQNLYRSVDIDEEIAAMLYRAVAEILAHIYRLKGRVHR